MSMVIEKGTILRVKVGYFKKSVITNCAKVLILKNEGITIQMVTFALRILLTHFIVHGSLGPRLFCLFFCESYQIDKASTRKAFIKSCSKDALTGQHQARIKGGGGAGGQMSSLQLH